MDEKMEYFCECGRHFIIPGAEGQPKKCPKCARIMYTKTEQKEEEEDQFEQKSKKSKSPLDNLDDTLEYEYEFDKQGQRLRKGSEPSTFIRFFKKIMTLFSFGTTTDRNY